MNVKLLTDYYLEFLSLKISCTGLSESTLVKTPHCRKSHVAAHIYMINSLWHTAKNELIPVGITMSFILV